MPLRAGRRERAGDREQDHLLAAGERRDRHVLDAVRGQALEVHRRQLVTHLNGHRSLLGRSHLLCRRVAGERVARGAQSGMAPGARQRSRPRNFQSSCLGPARGCPCWPGADALSVGHGTRPRLDRRERLARRPAAGRDAADGGPTICAQRGLSLRPFRRRRHGSGGQPADRQPDLREPARADRRRADRRPATCRSTSAARSRRPGGSCCTPPTTSRTRAW